jgi:hypothetical protein
MSFKASNANAPSVTTIGGANNSICRRRKPEQLHVSAPFGVELLPFASFGLHKTALVTKISPLSIPDEVRRSSKLFPATSP